MMDNLVKVKDNPGLYRDPLTKAIIVNDPVTRQSYLTQRQILQKSLSSHESVREEINTMKEELSSMRAMLQDIISHVKNN